MWLVLKLMVGLLAGVGIEEEIAAFAP